MILKVNNVYYLMFDGTKLLINFDIYKKKMRKFIGLIFIKN